METAKQYITKDTVVAEIVQNYPQATEVLLGFGFHCVGCHASNVETLEEGALGHGFSEEQLNEVVAKVNEAIHASKTATSSGVTLTKSAIKKVSELLEKENKKDHSLRISVVPGGCAGFSYDLSFDNNKTDDDSKFTFDAVSVLVDKKSLEYINGVTIDFVDSLSGSGFKIENPNAKKSCGCGNSFR